MSLKSRRASGLAMLQSHKVLLSMFTLVLLFVFWLSNGQVLSADNLRNILVQTAYLMIFTAAHSLVVMSRGFDLSLGNTVSLVSVVTALGFGWYGGGDVGAILFGIACGLATGFAVGLVNGLIVSFIKINALIVTLGTMNVVATLAATVSGGFPVPDLPRAFVNIASLSPLGIPIQIWIMALGVLAMNFVLGSTVFGRVLLIMGANQNAAQMAGARVYFHRTAVYVACSVITAVGAILLTSRMGSGEPSVGGTLTLETIAAAVVGGISLRGGQGDAFAPLIGALFITVLSNGMNLNGVDGYVQQIALGVIVIISLALDRRTSVA